MRLVHQECLRQWIQARTDDQSALVCELCHQPYKVASHTSLSLDRALTTGPASAPNQLLKSALLESELHVGVQGARAESE